jgi:hypothetical protein
MSAADLGSGSTDSGGLSALDLLPTSLLNTAVTSGASAVGGAAAKAVGLTNTVLGNATLIGVGVVLGLGALLIGSRDTIVNVSSKVTRTARMFV